MPSYLERFEQTPEADRWPLVRNWLFNEPLAFAKELRAYRPILSTPAATIVSGFNDCQEVLRRYETFGVDLYKPKQGGYWMAQDDTAQHWREKSIMRAVLDREDVSDIREFVAQKADSILNAAGGRIEAVNQLTRAVPISLVQSWFGFADSDPADLAEWAYWN